MGYSHTPEGTDFMNIEYRFAHSENKKIFKSNPLLYIPAFGGFCAYALAKRNTLEPVDPLSYKILTDKDIGIKRIHFFYKDDSVDALALWNQEPDEDKLIDRARLNWEGKAWQAAWACCSAGCPSKLLLDSRE